MKYRGKDEYFCLNYLHISKDAFYYKLIAWLILVLILVMFIITNFLFPPRKIPNFKKYINSQNNQKLKIGKRKQPQTQLKKLNGSLLLNTTNLLHLWYFLDSSTSKCKYILKPTDYLTWNFFSQIDSGWKKLILCSLEFLFVYVNMLVAQLSPFNYITSIGPLFTIQ